MGTQNSCLDINHKDKILKLDSIREIINPIPDLATIQEVKQSVKEEILDLKRLE